MVQSITEYVSYFEAGEDMTDTEYGIYMRAIHKFAYLDIEPDYSVLPPLVKAALRTVIASVRKNKEDRVNGSKGGAKTGNQNARKKQPEQDIQNNPQYDPPCFSEITNEKENVNDNVNVNANDKERKEEQEKQNISLPPKPVLEFNIPKDYAKQVFDILSENQLPCCFNNFITFMQTDFKRALETLHGPELVGFHSDMILGALKNYAQVVNNPNTWKGWKNKKSFDRFVSWDKFWDFLPDRFCLDNFLDRSTQPPTKAQNQTVGVNRALEILREVQNDQR